MTSAMDITIECRNLTKGFGSQKVVDHVSLQFAAGRVSALIGPNGAGKTTIFHMLGGVLRPDSGTVLYRGKALRKQGPWNVARRGIGRLFQDVRIFPSLTVLDNVMLAFSNQVGERPFGSLLFRGAVLRQTNLQLPTAVECLNLVNLGGFSERLASELSYGQQKLLAIARLIAAGSDVLLLDEPLAGVAPSLQASILSIIRHLADKGKTIAVIEHNIAAITGITDHLFFLSEGKIASQGLPRMVLDDPSVRAAYIGL